MRASAESLALRNALKPVRRRIRLVRGMRGLCLGLDMAGLLCLSLMAVSFFVPIAWLLYAMLGAAVICPVLGFLASVLWPISYPEAARQADRCGLKERARTAWALLGEDTPIAALQREDTLAHLKNLPLRQEMRFAIPRNIWIALAICVVLTGTLSLLPNPQHGVLKAREQMRVEFHAQADKIEKAAEEMEEEGLTEEERAELRRLTSELSRKLRDADDQREALRALDDIQQELQMLRKMAEDRRMAQMQQALAGQPMLKSLSQALSQASSGALDSAMQEMADAMQSPEDAKELAEALEKALEDMPEGDLKDAMQAVASAATSTGTSGQPGGNMQAALQGLAQAMAGTSANAAGGNLSALMRLARSSIARSGQGVGQGQGAGQGAGQGQGTGSGSGQGGMGQGGGGGAGRGTTQRDAGYKEGFTQSNQGMGGSGAIADRVGEYERIYDPTRLGGDAPISQVEGQHGESDTQQLQLSPGMGDMSGSVPYGQVIGDYRDSAAQAMRRDALPSAVQQWVTQYFDALVD